MQVTQADGAVANTVRDWGSPAEVAAREVRVAVYAEQRKTRLAAMAEARRVRRTHGVRTVWELMAELNNLVSSIEAMPGSDLDSWRDRVLELATDLDAELVPDDVAETGTEPRGEYDSLTVGVRGRG